MYNLGGKIVIDSSVFLKDGRQISFFILGDNITIMSQIWNYVDLVLHDGLTGPVQTETAFQTVG